MFRCWCDDARELAFFDPRRVEEFLPTDPISENNSFAHAIAALVFERLLRLRLGGCRQRGSIHHRAVHETVTHRRELEEPATPDDVIGQRVRIEAGGYPASITQPNADSARDRHARAAKDATLDRTKFDLIPTVAGPSLFVLVPPMTEYAAVETWKLRQ